MGSAVVPTAQKNIEKLLFTNFGRVPSHFTPHLVPEKWMSGIVRFFHLFVLRVYPILKELAQRNRQLVWKRFLDGFLRTTLLEIMLLDHTSSYHTTNTRQIFASSLIPKATVGALKRELPELAN